MARSPVAWLEVRLLGVPTWAVGAVRGPLEGNAALLVAMVATHGAATATDVSKRMWGENAGRNNLHTNVGRLRKQVPHEVLIAEKSRVCMHPQARVDLLAPPEQWPRGADPARVEFLHGVKPPEGLRPWVDAERERWRRRLAAAELLARADEWLAVDSLPAALDAVRQAIDLAPDLAEGWLAKGRLLFLMNGDVVAARRALDQAIAKGVLHPEAAAKADELRRSLDGVAVPRPRRLPMSLVRPPLIGRDAAWSAAQRASEARRPFFLIGDNGAGKTRLLHDFLMDHGPHRLVEAPLHGERAPYSTLAAVLESVLDLLQVEATELPPALRTVVGLPEAEGRTPRFDEAAVLSAAREWLTSVAADVGTLAIDRMERADAASVDLLRRLAAGPLREHLRFALAGRPPLPGARRDQLDAWCRAKDGLRLVALAPWTVEQLAELLRRVELPRAAALVSPADLHEHTGGMPQLVLFMLQELAARDTLPVRRGPSAAGSADALATLARRLLGIPPWARRVLEVCAVMDAGVPMLARALDCSEIEVHAALDELVLHDVLTEGLPLDDLAREAVCAATPPAAVARWNATAATLLTQDPRVSRARIAAHWEAAERWREAAASYRDAATRAVALGSAAAALDLFQQAARCAALAGDGEAEFDALHDAVPQVLALTDRDTLPRLLERLRDLAGDDPVRRVRVALVQALLELEAYRRGPDAEPALLAAEAALEAAQALEDANLLAKALAYRAVALAQVGRHEAAVDEGRQAWALAQTACPARLAREIGTDLCFVLYEGSRLGDAVGLARELVAAYQAAGDVAGAAMVESNLATMLLRTGEPEASLAPAMRAHARLRELDPSATNDAAVVNRVALSQALAFRGDLREALAMLSEAGQAIAESGTLPYVRAMVRAQRAHVLLLLGDGAGALAALGDEGELPVSQRIQAESLRLRAARLMGQPEGDVLARLEALLRHVESTPLPHSPWWASSLFGEPARAAERLLEVQQRCISCGMLGVARSVAVRRLQLLAAVGARWAIDEAASEARSLQHEMSKGAGLAASTYLPEAWLAMAAALRRAGHSEEADAALLAARQWVRRCLADHVPADRQQAFRLGNPVNAEVLAFQSDGAE